MDKDDNLQTTSQMSFSLQASTGLSPPLHPFLPPLQDEEDFNSNNRIPSRPFKSKARSKSTTFSGITPSSALGEVGRSVFACNFCSMTFTVAASLKEHVNGIHLQIKMFHCEMCGEAFKWRSDLSKHRRIVCPFTAVVQWCFNRIKIDKIKIKSILIRKKIIWLPLVVWELFLWFWDYHSYLALSLAWFFMGLFIPLIFVFFSFIYINNK